MATIIELKDNNIYLSTDNRPELLELISFIVKNYNKLEETKRYAVTIYDFREPEE